MSRLFLSAPELTEPAVHEALNLLGLSTLGLQVDKGVFSVEISSGLSLSKQTLDDRLSDYAQTHRIDYAIIDQEFTPDRFGLLAMDMDSTLITIECIDEIADYIGKKTEVAAITEAAMRGEIKDFKQSLLQRVALLKGVPESALEAVFNDRLQFSPGAGRLIEFAKHHQWKTLLVSGGFTFFTQRIKQHLSLDYAFANTLEIVNGHLTGRVVGDIVDGDAKKAAVQRVCADLGLNTSACLAIGDGANDLPMMSVAGISVAYRAKPAVRAKTDYQINFGPLDTATRWFVQ